MMAAGIVLLPVAGAAAHADSGAISGESVASGNGADPWGSLEPIDLPDLPIEAARAWLQAVGAPLNDDAMQALVRRAAGHRLVLLGESTHGTQEYYVKRARLSRALVEQARVRFVAVEGDWSAIAKLDAYAMGRTPDGTTARSIMATFHRWPTWMWANEPFADFVEWLRSVNTARPDTERVRLYGTDVYDAAASARSIEALLADDGDGPVYACLGSYFDDLQIYARDIFHGHDGCADETEAVVARVRGSADRFADADAHTQALFGARVVRAAERHYRAMARQQQAESWNSRAGFFFDATQALLELHGEDSIGIFWGHNTHVGDARATDMAVHGMVTIGQQARTALGEDEVFIIGFAKRDGNVVAGRQWGAPAQIMPIDAPPPGTWDAILADIDHTSPWAVLFRGTDPPPPLRSVRPKRAIGVTYDPAGRGGWSNTRLADRYDALIVYGETAPLRALDTEAAPER